MLTSRHWFHDSWLLWSRDNTNRIVLCNFHFRLAPYVGVIKLKNIFCLDPDGLLHHIVWNVVNVDVESMNWNSLVPNKNSNPCQTFKVLYCTRPRGSSYTVLQCQNTDKSTLSYIWLNLTYWAASTAQSQTLCLHLAHKNKLIRQFYYR